MNNDLTYDILWQAYQKEKRTNELQLISKTFYEEMGAFIGGITRENTTAEERLQKDNAVTLLNGIFEKRKQKILMYAAYGKQLPGPVPQTEADLYESAGKLLRSSTIEYNGDSAAQSALRSMQAIPEVILPSGAKIGPLEKDQIIVVKDREDRRFLVNSKICKEQ